MVLTEAEKKMEARIATLSSKDRDHLKECIHRLVMCYGEDACTGMLLVKGHLVGGVGEVITLNCNDMEAAEMLEGMRNYFEYITMKGAPPKERFN
jgi:hypothetical protein